LQEAINSPVPQGQSKIAHQFIGGFQDKKAASPGRDGRNQTMIEQVVSAVPPELDVFFM